MQPRATVAKRAVTSTHTRAPHTRKVNGRQVQVRRSRPIQTARQLNEGLAQTSRQALAHWRAMRAPGPGRREFIKNKTRAAAVTAGGATAFVVWQGTSGAVAVLAGVVVVAGSLLLAAFLPQKTRKRWKKRAKRVQAWFHPHVQRGRKVAQTTRAKTRPRKARA